MLQRPELALLRRDLRSRHFLLTDYLEILEGDSVVAQGVSIDPTPGHTPGHQSVWVGDLVSITYVYDDDPAAAAQTRERLLIDLTARDGVLATGHFAEPFTRG